MPGDGVPERIIAPAKSPARTARQVNRPPAEIRIGQAIEVRHFLPMVGGRSTIALFLRPFRAQRSARAASEQGDRGEGAGKIHRGDAEDAEEG
jgi:hypothetical protein